MCKQGQNLQMENLSSNGVSEACVDSGKVLWAEFAHENVVVTMEDDMWSGFSEYVGRV